VPTPSSASRAHPAAPPDRSGKLPSGSRTAYKLWQSFLEKAREALQAQDFQRAFTLADKAYLLADE